MHTNQIDQDELAIAIAENEGMPPAEPRRTFITTAQARAQHREAFIRHSIEQENRQCLGLVTAMTAVSGGPEVAA